MDTTLLITIFVLISLDTTSCQDAELKCPVVGIPLTTCQDKCIQADDSFTSTCGNRQACCLVKCGYQCINPAEYDVDTPVFKSHSPQYGPLSGGTVVVITGDFTHITFLTSAYLQLSDHNPQSDEDIKTEFMNIVSRNFTHIVLQSKSVQQEYLNLKWLIHLDYKTEDYTWSTNTNMVFSYREDPTITGLYPRSAFISGGIALTAVGENLDSVANPVMLVHMERRRNVNTDEYAVIGDYTFRSENTYVYNGSAIVGITPQINTSATDNFKTGLNSQGGAQRRRRQTVTDQPSDNPYDPINSETLEFFIGFELDGVTRFENLSRAIDDETGRLKVFAPPHIERYKETKKYDPDSENELVIKGERLRLGSTIEDYLISLGTESCEVVDLQDNVLHCSPPKEEPQSSSSHHDLKVSIGYLEFNVGRVEYVKDNTLIFIIIGCVAGGVLLVVIIVGVSVVCCKNKSVGGKKWSSPEQR